MCDLAVALRLGVKGIDEEPRSHIDDRKQRHREQHEQRIGNKYRNDLRTRRQRTTTHREPKRRPVGA